MRYLFSCFCSTHLDPKSLYKCSRIIGSAGRSLMEEDPVLLGERLCLAGLFCFWAVLSMWLHSWLLFRSFLTQRASKARQAAEKTGLHCNKVLCLLQGKISVAQEDTTKLQKHQGYPAELMRAVTSNNDDDPSKWKHKCQENKNIYKEAEGSLYINQTRKHYLAFAKQKSMAQDTAADLKVGKMQRA